MYFMRIDRFMMTQIVTKPFVTVATQAREFEAMTILLTPQRVE